MPKTTWFMLSNKVADLAKACDVTWERDRRKVWYVLFSISGFSDELCAHAATRDDLLLIDDRGR